MPGHGNAIATQSIDTLTAMSNLPPSFGGSPILYASALTSVMSIACLGIAVCGWMIRDTWRDRFHIYPTSLLFLFRTMMGVAGFAAFFRAMPEVLYLQVYGDPDVSTNLQAFIITLKRFTDTLALGFVVSWILILVTIYPPLVVALKSGPAGKVQIDAYSSWPRLRRPVVCFICIIVVSIAFAYAKVYAR